MFDFTTIDFSGIGDVLGAFVSGLLGVYFGLARGILSLFGVQTPTP